MKVLVTGGSGDIGTYVVKELLSHGLETTVLDVRPPRIAHDGLGYVECDLMRMEAAVAAIRGFDAVVHLAAIPHPFSDPAERVMTVNMVTTYNVIEAVRLNGIPRIVYGCSESSTGFGIHNVELKPLYLPIDEAHPCWPHEVYSFTKRFGEVMVRDYTKAYGVESISLRYCWVWLDRDREAIRNIVQAGLRGERDPKSWFGCYVAPHDVAQAVRRAVTYRFTDCESMPFEAFYICADTTFFADPTLDVLNSHFDPLPEVRDKDYFETQPFAPPFDCRKARILLGFRPQRDWRDFERWERP